MSVKLDALSSEGLAVLERAIAKDTLVAFDYDGTLAPIAAAPDEAVMSPSTSDLLRSLTTLYPTIVITGRSQRDVMRRLHGLKFLEVIGNHGIEPSDVSPLYASLALTWRSWLERVLAGAEGVWVEDKVYSLAVHYRGARYEEAARARIEVAVAGLPSARVVGGKAVVNLIPAGAPHKGTALLHAMERHACSSAIYVGDDVTDEDVFRLHPANRVLGIRVGRDPRSDAALVLAEQTQIDELLRHLIRFRAV